MLKSDIRHLLMYKKKVKIFFGYVGFELCIIISTTITLSNMPRSKVGKTTWYLSETIITKNFKLQ